MRPKKRYLSNEDGTRSMFDSWEKDDIISLLINIRDQHAHRMDDDAMIAVRNDRCSLCDRKNVKAVGGMGLTLTPKMLVIAAMCGDCFMRIMDDPNAKKFLGSGILPEDAPPGSLYHTIAVNVAAWLETKLAEAEDEVLQGGVEA